MTEKTTPELPFELVMDHYGDGLELDRDDHGFYVQPTGRQRAIYVDPAELMRNLAAFVPGPQYAPNAWLDKDANLWVDPDSALALHWLPTDGSVTDGIPWYAHPPVTAEPDPACSDWPGACQHTPAHDNGKFTPEPAAAPSVEQIAVSIALVEGGYAGRWQAAAEAIRALYSTQGDAGEVHSLAWWRQQCNGQESRAMEAEERAAKAEREVTEWQQSRDRAEIARANAVAEVERYKAALEAAEAVIEALNYRFGSTVALQRARDDDDRAASMIRTAREKHRAARAAVEAETSEEAGA